MTFVRILAVLLGAHALGCSSGDANGPHRDGGTQDGGPTAATVRFEPSVDAMEFGQVPFPSDLYMDGQGKIRLQSIAGESSAPDPAYYRSLRESLAEIDGFSSTSAVFFGVDGRAADPGSLPSSSAASVDSAASVFLVDVDPTSPTAFDHLPADVSWDANGKWIRVRPADGYSLTPSGHYAAVVTNAVRDDAGAPLVASAAFAQMRDRVGTPSTPLDTALDAVYATTLSSLASNGVARASIVGLAVFHVQNVDKDMLDVRTAIRSEPAPAVTISRIVQGSDLDSFLGSPTEPVAGFGPGGGVTHTHVGWMVHGLLTNKNFTTEDPTHHGRLERDSQGAVKVKSMESVPFTLWLPSAGDLSSLRVIIFQHGLGSQRGAALGIVNACNEAGWAVIAIDAPFHGLRAVSTTPDTHNEYTGASQPDGFGDETGSPVVVSFAGIGDAGGELVDSHPFYLRDTIRQSSFDLLSTAHALRTSSAWQPLRDAAPALSSLDFADDQFGFVGVSLGGIIGTVFVASEPDIGAALLNVTGGSLARLVSQSANMNLFLNILLAQVGLRPSPGRADLLIDDPIMALWQTLADRGDSMSFAPTLRAQAKHLLMHMAFDDETVPNVATESLANMLGAPMAGNTPRFVAMQSRSLPIEANFALGDSSSTRVTRGLVVFDPATHGMLTVREGESDFEHPVMPPFAARSPSMMVNNPVDAAQDQMIHFFETWANTGRAEIQ